MEGKERDKIRCVTLVFVWRDWETPLKLSVIFACARNVALTGYLQNTNKERRSALTNTLGHVFKQTPHKSRITSYIRNRGEETHKRTMQAISASHARKSRRLFVRPLRTQVVSIINVCARFLWPGVYLGRQDYTTYSRSFGLKCNTIDVSGDAVTQAATLNTFVETPQISAVCCSLFRDSVSR